MPSLRLGAGRLSCRAPGCAIEFAFLTSVDLEPRTLPEALKPADADKGVAAAPAETRRIFVNGTWALAQRSFPR